MRYTGIRDKNGRKIYNGDILRWKDKGEHSDVDDIIVVFWSDELLAWAVRGKEWGKDFPDEFLYEYRRDDIEVIGNIIKGDVENE